MAPRAFTVYYNVLTRKIYGDDGGELANNNMPYIKYKERLNLTVQLISSATITDKYNPVGVVAAEAAVDDDWVHYYEGALTAGKSGAVVAITADGFTSPDIYTSGTLYLINAAGEAETVAYTAYTLADGVYTFTVSDTLTYTYANNDVCRLVAHPLINVLNAAIDKTNAATGLFVVSLYAYTQPYQRAINGKKEISSCNFGLFLQDNAGDDIISVMFSIKCENRLIDEATVPPAPDEDYYTKVEVDALLTNYLAKILVGRVNATEYEFDIDDTTPASPEIGLKTPE